MRPQKRMREGTINSYLFLFGHKSLESKTLSLFIPGIFAINWHIPNQQYPTFTFGVNVLPLMRGGGVELLHDLIKHQGSVMDGTPMPVCTFSSANCLLLHLLSDNLSMVTDTCWCVSVNSRVGKRPTWRIGPRVTFQSRWRWLLVVSLVTENEVLLSISIVEKYKHFQWQPWTPHLLSSVMKWKLRKKHKIS